MVNDINSIWTIEKTLAAADSFLKKHGSLAPRLEAERLMANILDVERIDLYIQYDRPLLEDEREAYRETIKVRARGLPLQYIIGEQGFRKITLKVSPEVLIPRPETELLVEYVIGEIDRLRDKKRDEGREAPVILDIGTGSGAISISLAYEVDNIEIWALDRSSKALEIAIENASTYDLHKKIRFFKSDIFSGVKDIYAGRFDIIVANPPYIATGMISKLPVDVRHEPIEALDGGAEGLDFYQSIIVGSKEYLKSGGSVIFEVGDDQANRVIKIFTDNFFSDIHMIQDYSGRDRIVAAKLSDDGLT